MPELWLHDWEIRVAGLRIVGLDAQWEITKSDRAKRPSSCTLTIFGLGEDDRRLIESLNLRPKKKGVESGAIRVEIEAGYKSIGRTLRFRGDMRYASSSRDDGDWQTTIEGEDGGRSVLVGRVHHSLPPGTTYLSAMTELARAMGLGIGNAGEIPGATRTMPGGAVLRGEAGDELHRLLRGLGANYSVQNGVIVVRHPGQARLRVVELSSANIVDHPKKNADGRMSVRTLLLPELVPGAHVAINTTELKGVFRIRETRDTCSTFASDWYTDSLIEVA